MGSYSDEVYVCIGKTAVQLAVYGRPSPGDSHSVSILYVVPVEASGECGQVSLPAMGEIYNPVLCFLSSSTLCMQPWRAPL